VKLNGDAAGVVLEVRNRGPVIDPSDLDQIFDPLRWGSNNENKREADGSLGLGLYIAREMPKTMAVYRSPVRPKRYLR
jgi:signal transduction histidine kinase